MNDQTNDDSGASSHEIAVSPPGHPDVVLRMAAACWRFVAPQTLLPDQAAWLAQRLVSHAPFTWEERARVVPPLLAALEGDDARCAAVVRGHLAGDPDPPHRGVKSHEGLVKLLTIVKNIQDAQDEAALEEPPVRARKRTPARKKAVSRATRF